MGRIIAMFLIMLFLHTPALASRTDSGLLRREAILDTTFRKTAQSFGLPYELVTAIARQESWCRPLVVNIAGKDYHPQSLEEAVSLCKAADARNLQYDVGIMQINRYWIRKYNIPLRMLFNPRDNIYMGCYILSNEIKRHGFNWEAIGRYHSHTQWRRINYAQKIRKHLVNIMNQKGK